MSEALCYLSTRGGAPAATLGGAIAAGLAPDGGLYVPERLPARTPVDFDPHGALADTAATLLAPPPELQRRYPEVAQLAARYTPAPAPPEAA